MKDQPGLICIDISLGLRPLKSRSKPHLVDYVLFMDTVSLHKTQSKRSLCNLIDLQAEVEAAKYGRNETSVQEAIRIHEQKKYDIENFQSRVNGVIRQVS